MLAIRTLVALATAAFIASVPTEEAKLVPGDPQPGQHFGYSVAVSGDTAVVGAWVIDHSGRDDWCLRVRALREGSGSSRKS